MGRNLLDELYLRLVYKPTFLWINQIPRTFLKYDNSSANKFYDIKQYNIDISVVVFHLLTNKRKLFSRDYSTTQVPSLTWAESSKSPQAPFLTEADVLEEYAFSTYFLCRTFCYFKLLGYKGYWRYFRVTLFNGLGQFLGNSFNLID